ncbi:Hydrogenase maturation protein, carbamoyltransferase HypF [Consotaella salsifontis]|uniref:Carbamoyltransferase HypF n=2 Tax=Consotaella salsifontis TaxID=1365950 RepID=A0A1T4SNK6_9HYPH|nr:Hydrogenase maturation protein, carbamoyltransferase HypF [Consotaella salsifontis]
MDEAAANGRRILVSGRVQGVGFRPFVYRIAHAHGLTGWVRNGAGRVIIEIAGAPEALAAFETVLIKEAPPLARPRIDLSEPASLGLFHGFEIRHSEGTEEPDIHLPPDLFCCAECVAELSDPSARRHRYPFTNCTQCGPRYTIIRALPYDRPATSMAGFPLCPDCAGEYSDPLDRRFHAQPLACPACGPRLSFVRAGAAEEHGEQALAAAVACLSAGGIVAVKGIGGYHLVCDARDEAAVARLRSRKHRPTKPFAVMIPQEGIDGLDAVRRFVSPDAAEAAAIADPARPIVLTAKRPGSGLAAGLAPGLAELGVFLPYSPLHHLLLGDFGAPIVATSGNISGEPVITDEDEAHRRLAQVADAFLDHDRPIVRPADDSVVRVIAGKARPIRIGRGVAPLEIELARPLAEPTLAVGGHMKGAIALGWGRRAVVSPHIGELDSPRSLAVFSQVAADLQALYAVEATRLVADVHPDYASTRWALSDGRPVTLVQHHVAHASAIAGENPDVARWLVFAWDGVGLGPDNELWGGEALLGAPGGFHRVGSIRQFRLVGGDKAGREPWRSAAGLMWEACHDWLPEAEGGAIARQAWEKRVRTLSTSSIGRLFDAAAALALGIERVSFEGEGPMRLEAMAEDTGGFVDLPIVEDGYGLLRLDWAPLLSPLTDPTLSPGGRAALFHESLARGLVRQALAVARHQAFDAVGLCGGVFQNRRLAERVAALFVAEGIAVHLPETVPANDGGLAFGQLIEAQARDARSL